jgi:hypothetical protein
MNNLHRADSFAMKENSRLIFIFFGFLISPAQQAKPQQFQYQKT